MSELIQKQRASWRLWIEQLPTFSLASETQIGTVYDVMPRCLKVSLDEIEAQEQRIAQLEADKAALLGIITNNKTLLVPQPTPAPLTKTEQYERASQE